MRLSNEEFAAEVLRRSAQKQHADRIRRKRILMTVGSAAACLMLVIGISVRGQITKNTAPNKYADDTARPAGNEAASAEQSPQYEQQRKSEEYVVQEHKNGDTTRSAAVLSTEQTAVDLAQTPQIKVTFRNTETEAVTVSAHDFVFLQAELRCTLPDDTDADSITVSPGETGTLTLSPADYIGEKRGDFTLVCIPFDAKLTLTFL